MTAALRTAASEVRFSGEPAVELRNRQLRARFVPGVGMTGVSLQLAGREYLALPGGLAALRGGHTAGLPLLAPWANRLGANRYRVGNQTVDLAGLPLHRDANGLPIHGLLVGRSGWRVERLDVVRGTPRVRATFALDDPAFPFPHTIVVEARAHEDRLVLDTTVVATGRRAVPVAFGWHPYLRLPGLPRRDWTLRLPGRVHLPLDGRGLPTGERVVARAEHGAISRRTFDDLYALTTRRSFALESESAAVRVVAGDGYGYVQVWVPPARPFAALEPMVVATDALRAGPVPLVEPGDSYRARATLVLQ
jgi:galactose mutarotase-like enzyme